MLVSLNCSFFHAIPSQFSCGALFIPCWQQQNHGEQAKEISALSNCGWDVVEAELNEMAMCFGACV